MHYEDSSDDYHPRPLLPTDEEALTSQIAKNKLSKKTNITSLPKNTRFHISPLSEDEYDDTHKDLSISQRSASNRNMNELLKMSKNKPAMQKALTDTNNFIEIFNRDNKNYDSNNNNNDDDNHLTENSDDEVVEDYENEHYNDDNLSLGSIDNTMSADTLQTPRIIDIIPEVADVKSKMVNDKTKNPPIEETMTLHPTLKKRQDEWADRGAAKVTKEVVNPNTGEKTKKVIKKGIKDFKFGDEIGDGAYSTVMLATSIDSGKKYAVKVLNKEYLIKQKKVKYVNIEKNALQRVNNSNSIIKLYFTFQDETSLYFLLEYAPNGDFLSLLKKYGSLNEDAVRYYSAQIIDAIGYLHSKGIIHRDMKPENILLDSEWKVKLTDFGTAKILERSSPTKKYDLLTRSKSFVGTAEYVSPELLNDSYSDYRCDIWAFGCILFQMIAGKPPFKATNEYLTFQKVMKVQYAFTAGFPTVVRDLVKRILLKPIDQRLTISQIERHHFYRSVNFKDGSVWSNPVPELSAYKVTAKSMQPIPALKGPMIYKRPQISTNIRKSSSSVPPSPASREPSQSRIGSTSNIMVPSTSSHHLSNSPSPHTPSTPVHSSPSPLGISLDKSSRKGPDERTSAILENAKRSVETKKQMLNKRIASSSSHTSVATSAKKNQDSTYSSTNNTTHLHTESTTPTSYNRKHSNSGPTSFPSDTSKLAEKKFNKSDLDLPSHSPPPPPKVSHFPYPPRPSSSSKSSNRSKTNVRDSPTSTPKPSNLAENVQEQTIQEQTIPRSPSINVIPAQTPTPVSLNKQDIQWSFYLKSIQEHVLLVQEIYVAAVDTNVIDRKLSRSNKRLTEPLEFNQGRSTLLSQVARSGGDVTGFRHSDSRPPEEDYYTSSYIDESAIIEDYRYHFEFSQLLMSDENSDESPSESPVSPPIGPNASSHDESNNAFSGKVKKFFQQAKSGGLLDNSNTHERFLKRTVVITSFGRLLVFVRYLQQASKSSNNVELLYDINLCQIGTEIKEILMTTPQNNLAVIETPYKSFLLCNTINTFTSKSHVSGSNIDSWFKVMKKSINMAADQNKPTHVKKLPRQSSSKDQAQLAKHPLKSPQLPHSKPDTPKLNSPRISHKERKFTSPVSNENKHTFTESLKASGNNKGSRMFSTYVSSKEKQHKKHTSQPIPTSTKLVNGLPSTSASVLLGLGLNSNSHSGKVSNDSSSSPSLSSNSKFKSSKFGFKH